MSIEIVKIISVANVMKRIANYSLTMTRTSNPQFNEPHYYVIQG